MNGAARTRVLSVQTTLLGNRTYGEILRRAFAESQTIDFDAHWSTEAEKAFGSRPFERQLNRVFLKMIQRPAIRRRNLDFFPLRYEIGTSYWATRTMRRLLRERRPDVLHFHTQAIAMLSLDVMARIPTVVSADGTSYQMAAQQLDERWRWTFAGNHALERLVFARAAAVVTFSRWAAESVIAEHGIDARKVHVIPPGIELDKFASVAAARERNGTHGPRRILFVGGEFERKGGPLLVEAFLSRFGNDAGVELHVVSESARVPDHPRIFVHAGVRAYSEAWFEAYRSADLFVMPTKRDQSPMVYLEAMAAGVPVITTPVGSAAEIVLDGETGFIVEPAVATLADRMATLLDDRPLRTRFGSAGRNRVAERYEVRTNARALERLLASVAKPAL